MPTLICVDGLGGNPFVTFGPLKSLLERSGHEVVIPDTSEIRTHEDRIQLAIDSYIDCLEKGRKEIYLCGQSAGGSAVRVATERLEEAGVGPDGLILLSPAMPRGILFLTLTALRVMARYAWEMLAGQTAQLSKGEYESLVSPLAEGRREKLLSARVPISGIEAKELAFFPPKLLGPECPTLLIFGSEDKWIAPGAQCKLGKKLSEKSEVTTEEIKGAGHLTLGSEHRQEVLGRIQDWLAAVRSRS